MLAGPRLSSWLRERWGSTRVLRRRAWDHSLKWGTERKSYLTRLLEYRNICFKIVHPQAKMLSILFYLVMFEEVFLKVCIFWKLAVDIDECLEQPSVCGSHAICNNHPGTFRCECVEGHRFSEEGTCVGKFSGWPFKAFIHRVHVSACIKGIAQVIVLASVEGAGFCVGQGTLPRWIRFCSFPPTTWKVTWTRNKECRRLR